LGGWRRSAGDLARGCLVHLSQLLLWSLHPVGLLVRTRVMAEAVKRRRMFGPLFYVTAAVGVAGLMARAGLYLDELRNRESANSAITQAGLRSMDPQARLAAIESLGRSGSQSSVKTLVDEARDAKSADRAAACHALGNLGGGARELVPTLMSATGDERAEVRREAVAAIGALLGRASGRFGSGVATSADGLEGLREQASTICLRLLREDRDDDVRAAAVTALAEFGGGPWVGAIEAAMKDKVRSVKLAAALALLTLKRADEPNVARTLGELVADPDPVADRRMTFETILKDGSERLRDEAIGALAALVPGCEPGVLPEVLGCFEMAGPHAVTAVPALEVLVKTHQDAAVRGRAAVVIADALEPRDLSDAIMWDVAEPNYRGQAEPVTSGTDWKVGVKPYSPHVAAILGKILEDETMAYEWREAAILRLHDANPEALSKASRELTRQLGRDDRTVRVRALNLLKLIVGRVPVAVPGSGELE
jgi:HEAT repeat protein